MSVGGVARIDTRLNPATTVARLVSHAPSENNKRIQTTICEDEYAINGGPDGELVCRVNNDFYAGRYSDVWYCYAIWMREPDTIRVNAEL